MPTNDLYTMYEDSILELFKEARRCNANLFMRSLMVSTYPTVVTFPDGSKHRLTVANQSPEMEIAQAFVTVKAFEQAVGDDKIEKHVRAPLTLMLSFNLLEADLWHVILGNLLRVVAGYRRLDPNQFREQALGPKVNGVNRLLKQCRQRKKALSMCYDNLLRQYYDTYCDKLL